jgi:hypothetical protein
VEDKKICKKERINEYSSHSLLNIALVKAEMENVSGTQRNLSEAEMHHLRAES